MRSSVIAQKLGNDAGSYNDAGEHVPVNRLRFWRRLPRLGGPATERERTATPAALAGAGVRQG